MKKNVGRLDAMMRITMGLTGVAWGTANMIRRPNDSLSMLVTLASAMKVAEGITRFCPLTAMFTADYDRIMDRAKDRLPVDRFTDRLERRANQVQRTVRNAVNNTAQANTTKAGVNAVQDTVGDVTRNLIDEDDFEPHH